jgi:hypothetical protein
MAHSRTLAQADGSNLRTMSEREVIRPDDDVAVWLDGDGGITIRAATRENDPVELSSAQARKLAKVLLDLADREDAD